MKIDIFEHTQGKTPVKQEVIDERVILARTQKRTSGIERTRNLHLAWRRGLYDIFFRNEIAHFEEKITRRQIIDELLHKYKHLKQLRRNLTVTHRYSISVERRRYNDNSLYASQPPTFLTSIEYNWEHYPIVGGFMNQFYKDYLYWEEAYHRILEHQVADPRFVEYEAIVEIRNRQIRGEDAWLKWIVPTDKDLQTISRQLELDIPNIFNSVIFAPGFTREETPKDFIPFKDYLDKKKKAHERTGRGFPLPSR